MTIPVNDKQFHGELILTPPMSQRFLHASQYQKNFDAIRWSTGKKVLS